MGCYAFITTVEMSLNVEKHGDIPPPTIPFGYALKETDAACRLVKLSITLARYDLARLTYSSVSVKKPFLVIGVNIPLHPTSSHQLTSPPLSANLPPTSTFCVR